jgi:acetyl-CoA acetyltransferase
LYLTGIGATELRRARDREDVDLIVEACRAALTDAGLEPRQVTGINVQSHHAPAPDVAAAARGIGLKEITWAPEGGIGVPALATAALAVSSGRADAVLVCKVMNTATALNQPVIDPVTRRAAGRDQFELPYGLGYTVQRAALSQRRWMTSRGVTAAQLGAMCVVQREHALLNELAVFKQPLTLEQYLDSRLICDPMRLFDCDYPINGAYAYLLTRYPGAGQHPAVALRGWTDGKADDMPHIRVEYPLGRRPDVSALYADLGITPADLSVFLLYDGFSYLAAEWLERLGVVAPMAVGEHLAGPEIRYDGSTPLNTHGGQLSEGRMHAAGHILEAVRQLRGTAGDRQVSGAHRAVVTTAFPSTGAVAILERAS